MCAKRARRAIATLAQNDLPADVPEWYNIIMQLSDYIARQGLTFTEAASALGCTSQYLGRVSRGERQASPALTLKIERWSDGAVTRHELRPDVYPADAA